MRYHPHGRDDGPGGEVVMCGLQGGQLRMFFAIDLERRVAAGHPLRGGKRAGRSDFGVDERGL